MEDVPIAVAWIVGVLSAASLAFWVKIGLRYKTGEPLFQPTAEPLTAVPWMSLLLVLLLISQSLAGLLGQKSQTIKLVQTQANVMLMLLVIVVLGVQLTKNRETANGLGFTTDRWRQQVRAGAIGFIATVLPVVICLVATIGMREDSSEHPLLQAIKKEGSAEIVIWIWVSAVLMAPILEELVYRVVLQTWLQHLIGPRQALIVVAAVFAAVHRLPDAIPLFPLALILGFMYQQRRRFLEIVIVHALFNAVNLSLALLSTDS
jgi:membrane protease YdiL (CAAX protease family)